MAVTFCESLREGDVVYIPHRKVYAKVQTVQELDVRVMTMNREAVTTRRWYVNFINRPNKEETINMAEEETIISIRLLPGGVKKGAVVISKGDIAAVNTFQDSGDLDWNVIINDALSEIVAAEIMPLPEIEFKKEVVQNVPVATDDEGQADASLDDESDEAAVVETVAPATLKPMLARPAQASKLPPLAGTPKQAKTLFDF